MRYKKVIIGVFVGSLGLLGGVKILESVVLPESVPLASPLIQFVTNGDTFILTGILPNTSVKNELIVAANTFFGAENVVDNLTICKRVANVSWLKSVDSLIKIYSENNIEKGCFEFVGNMAILTGTVSNEAIKSEMTRHVEKLLGSHLILNNKLNTVELRMH